MSSEDIQSLGRMLRQVEDPATRRILERLAESIGTIKTSLAELEAEDPVGWLDIKLQAGWTEHVSAENYLPQYIKDRMGFVHLRGIIDGGTITDGTTIGLIAEGFRPEKRTLFSVSADNAYARIDILPGGEIVLEHTKIGGGGGYLSLDGVTYRAYQ